MTFLCNVKTINNVGVEGYNRVYLWDLLAGMWLIREETSRSGGSRRLTPVSTEKKGLDGTSRLDHDTKTLLNGIA